MTTHPIQSPEDQNATFIELFFDLVFVFAVTQMVGLLHHGLSLEAIGHTLLVCWLVWWAWSQFTWALNAANTLHPMVEFGTLVATAVAFFMAIAIPDAFHDRALWFAIAYVMVRLIGLGINIWVASVDPEQQSAVRVFATVSLGGLAAVIIGAVLGGSAQVIAWVVAIGLDLLAGAIGGQQEGWNIHIEHFAERHGLIMIIALGEALIVAAGGLVGADLSSDLIAIGVLAVLITCGLWWSYFARARLILEETVARLKGADLSIAARDGYSYTHLPMLLGVIAIAFVVEEAIAHPHDALHLDARIALSVGMVLFIGGVALSLWRTTGILPLPRTLIVLVTAIVVAVVGGVSAPVTLGLAFAGILVVALVERNASALPEVHHGG